MNQNDYYSDSIVMPNRKHLRLRFGQTIVGYKQVRSNQKEYFSKDNFWWRSQKIEYIHEDRSTELFDANRQMMFENDVVKLKKDESRNYTARGLILFDESKKSFQIHLFEEDGVVDLNDLSQGHPMINTVKVVSQLYN